MTGTLVLRAAGLAGAYLLVLTSVDPGDVAIAAVLGLAVAFALRTPERLRLHARGSARAAGDPRADGGRRWCAGARASCAFCLGRRRASPGFVEVPLGDRIAGRASRCGAC